MRAPVRTASPAQASAPIAEKPEPGFEPPPIAPMAKNRSRRTYRAKLLLVGLAFFIFAVVASSLFLMFGTNTISGQNIELSLSGPFTIGGGEVMPLQVAITNENAVPIQAATLIVNFPPGTQSIEEEGRELFTQRIPLDEIAPGETVNVPVRAAVFGEENEDKVIDAAVEYRVRGSNATFFKESEPLRFKISSSPIVISVESVEKVSSGQETQITLTVASNATNPLNDILVRADYPSGFDFSASNPEPASGQNVWLIDSLEPEEETTIVITGLLVGNVTDPQPMHFTAGIGSDRDALALTSVFSTASTEFEIEQPFLNVDLEINDSTNDAVSVEPEESIDVTVIIENTLDDTVYDARAEVSLSGNALSDFSVRPQNGFYSSVEKKITFEPSSIGNLREIAPGDTVELSLRLEPDSGIDRTPQINVAVDVSARRALEDRVSEELVGTAEASIRVASVATILGETGRDTSSWSDTGPIPPVAEEETTYTLSLLAENGSNDLSDVEVTATLPQYVEWLDETSGAGMVSFNETSRTVTWRIGNLQARESKIAAFQVELLPSTTQIGTTPTLLGRQRLKGTDQFTGVVVRADTPALTTELSTEAGFEENNGRVQSD